MTNTEPGVVSVPLRAEPFTRIIYCFALLAFFPSLLAVSSGWITLALGGGLASGIGLSAPLVIVALALFRSYQVLRYPAALDARPPKLLGKFLRFTGTFAMFVGAVAGVSLFLVKPITLVLFKTAGESGVGYFVVGFWLVMLANLGWLGCFVFELSRISGTKYSQESNSKPWSRRHQDFAVFGVLLAAAIALPILLSQAASKPCGETNLARCVSTTEGGVRRVVGLPHGEPVVLESTVEEIEMRQSSGGRKWSLVENPSVSLIAAGHPVSIASSAAVRVGLDAISVPEGVVLTLTVHDGAEETARFVTHFDNSAHIEKTATGGVRIVANLPANAKPGMRTMREDKATRRSYALDQVFIQMRSAIGSKIEAREWPLHINRPTTLLSNAAAPRQPYVNELFSAECKDKVAGKPGESLAFEGELGWSLWDVTFAEASITGPHTQFSPSDRVVCRDGEVWIVSYPIRRPELRLRRYSSDGHILRFIDTALPPAKMDNHEFDFVDPDSVREEGGQIFFERVVMRLSGNAKEHEVRRDLFAITP